MDIKDIARKSAETVREYMREQARELNARNCNIDYGDVLNIHSDIVRVECGCPAAVAGTGNWAKRFLEEHFDDMWCSARSIIEERERVKRLAEIRDDVEYRAVVDD